MPSLPEELIRSFAEYIQENISSLTFLNICLGGTFADFLNDFRVQTDSYGYTEGEIISDTQIYFPQVSKTD